MTLGQIAKSVLARQGRKRLTFVEVVASRRPAVFEDFGDSLLYLDGEVFILKDVDLLADAPVEPPVLDPRATIHAVGIETGWHHVVDCDCDICTRIAA